MCVQAYRGFESLPLRFFGGGSEFDGRFEQLAYVAVLFDFMTNPEPPRTPPWQGGEPILTGPFCNRCEDLAYIADRDRALALPALIWWDDDPILHDVSVRQPR